MLNKILYNSNKKPATECSTDSRQLHEATLSIQPILDKRIKIKNQYCLTPTNDREKGNPTNKLD